MSLQFLDPSRWRFRHFFVVVMLLSLYNLFGPKGFVRLYHMRQEATALLDRREKLQSDIEQLQSRMAHFRSSEFEQQRLIRSKLGYLKENEVSLEFSYER